MDDTGAGRSTHRNWVAGQIGLRDGGKNAVLFVTNVDELDLPVAAQPVDDGIEGVTNDAIAAFDSGVGKHLPQDICHFYRHRTTPFRGWNSDFAKALTVGRWGPQGLHCPIVILI